MKEPVRLYSKNLTLRHSVLQLVIIVMSLLFLVGITMTLPAVSVGRNLVGPTISITSTHTPTATARSTSSLQPRSPLVTNGSYAIPGQPIMDANTIALYHFDSPNGNIAVDATGYFTGTLLGNSTVLTEGLYAGVLKLNGPGSYVDIGNLGNFSQGTVEAYVDFSTLCAGGNQVILSAGGGMGSNNDVMVLSAAPGLYFAIYQYGVWHYAGSGINPCRYLAGGNIDSYFYYLGFPRAPWPYEQWRFHHVAGTWGSRGMEIWVDGVLHGVGFSDPNALPYSYYCNPQMYVSSPYYPMSCQTPVPAPPYPPGDYTGALPAYSKFLIGCNSVGECLNGRIDEVRISNVQRSFAHTVLPTITPTPTPAPSSLQGEYVVDANTIALFHMNQQDACPSPCVFEEVGRQNHTIIGSVVGGGRFGSGLVSTTNGPIVDLGSIGIWGSGTVEAWVKFADWSGSHQIINALRTNLAPNKILTFATGAQGGNLVLGINNGNDYFWVDSGVTAASLLGCWHHVAGTWGPRGMEIWVDGTLRNANRTYTGGMTTQVDSWRTGCDTTGNCMKGMMDEIRISPIQRTFTAAQPKTMSRSHVFSADEKLIFIPFASLGELPPVVSGCPFGN